jgi:hypothetical protein
VVNLCSYCLPRIVNSLPNFRKVPTLLNRPGTRNHAEISVNCLAIIAEILNSVSKFNTFCY